MKHKLFAVLAIIALAMSGTSYGQRSRGGVDRIDEILRESIIPKTPAKIERKIDPSKILPITENTCQNPTIIGEDSKTAIGSIDGIRYHIMIDQCYAAVMGPTEEMKNKLTEVKLWESILYKDFVYPTQHISKFAFEQETITKISLPNTVKCIDVKAFSCCQLSEITIPKSVETLERACFQGTPVRRVIFEGDTIKKIDSYSFMYCQKLEEIILPKNCTDLRREAFAGCTMLKNAVLPDNLTIIREGLFSDCPALTTVTFPTTITTIEARAFGGTGLINVSLPEGLVTIGQSAFAGSKIQTLYIPRTVTKLEWLSFADCTKLRKITMPKTLLDLEMLVLAFDGQKAYAQLFNNSPDPRKWTVFTWYD